MNIFSVSHFGPPPPFCNTYLPNPTPSLSFHKSWKMQEIILSLVPSFDNAENLNNTSLNMQSQCISCVEIISSILEPYIIWLIFIFNKFMKLPWGQVMSHKKFGSDRFSRFDFYWIQTNRQTSQIYIYRWEWFFSDLRNCKDE